VNISAKDGNGIIYLDTFDLTNQGTFPLVSTLCNFELTSAKPR